MVLRLVAHLLSGVKTWLDKSSFFQKFFLITCFILSIAYFLHFREVRVAHLELGSTAKQYVLAEKGFNFEDTERTRILREESLQDIGLIYYIDDEEINHAEQAIIDEIIKTPVWRELYPSLTFEDLTKAIEAVKQTLVYSEFADIRTVQKLEQMEVQSAKYLVCDVKNADSIWDEVEKASFPFALNDAAKYVLEKYKQYPWNLKIDFDVRHALRKKIKQQIPVKITFVDAGERIIDAGETVTRRHLCMLNQMKKVLTEEIHQLRPLSILGSLIFAAFLVTMGLIYCNKFYYSVFSSFTNLSLIAVVILMTLTLAKLADYFIVHQFGELSELCHFNLYLLFPAITLSILIGRSVAMVVSGFVAIILGITLAMDSNQFLIMNLSTAVIATIWVKGIRQRKEIFTICSKVWLCTIPLIFGFHFFENLLWSKQIVSDCIMTFGFCFGIAMIVIATLPLFESTFGIVTDMTLMEVGDPNQPLLRRLSLEASGTYQHSLGVANLAEQAAVAIGANALLCRIASLYHDIGKIIQPNYFTENVRDGFNMHQLLTPLESAQVIIQHVTEGIKLAENAHLPKPIIDIIREHHGTTLVYYFFVEQSRLKSYTMDEGFFHYPGPIPQSRESAIVMIADSIEAAYRCETVSDERKIAQLIESIVSEKVREHQLDASGLTFNDIEAIKRSILRSLKAITHSRPAYPAKPKSLSLDRVYT